jgi:hypothetical protein
VGDNDFFFKSLFPSLYDKVEQEKQKLDADIVSTEKYTGEWIMNTFNLKPGKVIGDIKNVLNKQYGDNLDTTPEEEVIDYLKKLASSLDMHYEMYDAIEEENYGKAETLINEMLHDYHVRTQEPLKEIKSVIDSFSGDLFIKATNSDDMEDVKSLATRYDLALLHPENWVVKKNNSIIYVADRTRTRNLIHELLTFYQNSVSV